MRMYNLYVLRNSRWAIATGVYPGLHSAEMKKMIGIGTIVNTAAVLVGGVIGMIFKKGIGDSMQAALKKAVGIAVILVGLGGVFSEMLTLKDGKLTADGSVMMIISLVVGTVIGELLRIEDRLSTLGDRLKKLVRAGGNDRFTEGFVTNTLVICVGAMAIVGSFSDGLHADPSTLFVKAILDGVIAVVFASTMGVGVLFAAIPLFLYQGALTLLAGALSGVMTDSMISSLSYVGSALIVAVGLNLTLDCRIKTGNMLPSLLVPIIWTVAEGLF